MKLSGETNQCQGCKAYFRSSTGFDKHRTGEHGVNRRCMTPDEMRAVGMSVNNDGWWVASTMSPELIEKRNATRKEK